MNPKTELMIYKHIVKEYGSLDFDEIRHGTMRDEAGCYMDCIMMEHGIRDDDNWDEEQMEYRHYKFRHYMFRWFFDTDNVWWDWYVEEYGEEPKGVKQKFDIVKEFEYYEKNKK